MGAYGWKEKRAEKRAEKNLQFIGPRKSERLTDHRTEEKNIVEEEESTRKGSMKLIENDWKGEGEKGGGEWEGKIHKIKMIKE